MTSPGFLLGYNTSGFSRTADILRVVDAVADAGFAAIEISFDPAHLHPQAHDVDAFARARTACARRGLDVACGAGGRFACGPRPHRPAWTSPDPVERATRQRFLEASIAGAARLGASVLALHAGPWPEGLDAAAALGFLHDGLSRLLPLARREGVRLAFEYHPDMLVRDLRGALALVRIFPDLTLTLDIGHLRCTEGDPLEAGIAAAAPYASHVHLEDIKGRTHKHLPIGDGDIPFGDVFAALRRAGFSGIVAAEFHSAQIDLDETLLASRTFSRLAPLAFGDAKTPAPQTS